MRFIFSIIFVAVGILFPFLFKDWLGTDKNTVYVIMSVLFISWLFSYLCLRIPSIKYNQYLVREIVKGEISASEEYNKLENYMLEILTICHNLEESKKIGNK